MKNKEKKIKVEFLGKSSNEVTQSIYKISMNDYTLLLDYGLYQCQDPVDNYKINHTRIKGIKPKEINYIFISHANIDHVGALPFLYRNGCTATTYIAKGNYDLLKIMLADSFKIMETEAIKLSNKHHIKASSLYNEEDIAACLSHIQECDFNQKIQVNDDISVEFISAHHIINSAQILLQLNNNGVIKRITYTGDIGSPVIPKPYILPFKAPDFCDLLIGECTYSGDARNHHVRDRAKDLEKIETIVNTTCIENKGKVLFPVFSLDRLQSILTMLYQLYSSNPDFKIDIVIDTPLGIKITDLWEDILQIDNQLWSEVINWKNIKYAKTWEDSLCCQHSQDPMIILASSGMCTNGRSVAWVKNLLPGSKNFICFCGFSSEDSLASKIKNGKDNKFIHVEGKPVANRCNVITLFSFSSHACQEELLNLYSTLNYITICLVHSESKSKIAFAEKLKEKLSKENKSAKVVAVFSDYVTYV